MGLCTFCCLFLPCCYVAFLPFCLLAFLVVVVVVVVVAVGDVVAPSNAT